MMRSMFSSVSGLRAHQIRMDVIGNNIANVNTIGYRSSRVVFQEVFSQTLKGAGAPDSATGRGGTNPMQVGLGIGVGSVDTLTSRGSVQRTDNPTDLSVDGDGFFIMGNGESENYMFTRAGNFSVDKLGNLTGANGMNVLGWMDYGGKANDKGLYEFDPEKKIEPINLYSDQFNGNKRMIAAQKTSASVFAGNLDASKSVANASSDPAQFTAPIIVYDNLGNKYKVNIKFWKTLVNGASGSVAADTQWSWSATCDNASIAGSGYLHFNEKGKVDPASAGPDKNKITVSPAGTVGTAPFDITLDFNKVSMYAVESSVKDTNIDGYPAGKLSSFSIGSDGIITGVYDNGQNQPLGMIAMASFENPAGLAKVGGNMYTTTTNSGDFKKAQKVGSEGVGMLNPGTLEMSNVDLSKEFTEMITTQRGFQANSRIITVSDEMLQELSNMKR